MKYAIGVRNSKMGRGITSNDVIEADRVSWRSLSRGSAVSSRNFSCHLDVFYQGRNGVQRIWNISLLIRNEYEE